MEKRNINDEFIENLWDIIMPFSKLLDWEITYNTIIIDGFTYQKAQEFFWNRENKVSKNDIDIFLSSLNLAKEKLGSLWKFISINLLEKPTLLSLYEDSLLELQNKFVLLENAVFLEAEKWWYNLSDDVAKKSYTDNTNYYLKQIFWNSISETPNEVSFIFNKVDSDFYNESNRKDDKKRLNKEEYDYITSAFWYIKNKVWYHTDYSPIEESNKKEIWENIFINKELQLSISKDMMNYEFKENNIENHNWQIVSKNVNTWSADQIKEEVVFPNEDKQPEIELWKLFWSYTHEFWKHAVSWYNTNKYLGKWFKGNDYLETEEWLAKVFEAVASGKVNTIWQLWQLLEKPTFATITMLICEHYNEKESIKIMNIYKKLLWLKTTNVEEIIQRRKRFIHPEMIWCSPKDMAYSRWLNKVIYLLQEQKTEEELWNMIHDLNTFKLNIQDRHKIPQLKKELWIKDNELMKTNFIGVLTSKELWIALQNIWEKNNSVSFDILTKKAKQKSLLKAQELAELIGSKK